MKKKSKTNYETNSLKIVPEIGYVLLGGFLCILMIYVFISLLIVFKQRWNEVKLYDLIFPLCILIMTLYVLITIVKICNGKIYLEILDGYLIFSGPLLKKHMDISNIETIKRVSGYKQLTSIIILRKKDKGINQSKTIQFPLVFFADRDINHFLNCLNKTNKKIEWRGFYS